MGLTPVSVEPVRTGNEPKLDIKMKLSHGSPLTCPGSMKKELRERSRCVCVERRDMDAFLEREPILLERDLELFGLTNGDYSSYLRSGDSR